jgi:pyrimidine-specific ribonucleoside hydrolase
MSIPVIIDCDPGHDDAIALLLAVASPELEVLGVTTVAGNATLDKTTRNALTVLELAGRTDIPVAAGASAPLARDLVSAEHIHGKSGLDGPVLPEPSGSPVAQSAAAFIADLIRSSPVPVTLIPTGPLTNIAQLLRDHPDVIERVQGITFMGGAAEIGNVTPNAEFNIYVDPEAADIVVSSGLPITMIGLEVTHQALFGEREAEAVRGRGRAATFVAELLDFFVANHPRTYSTPGAPVHDVVAVAHVIDPTLVSTERCGLRIDTGDGLGRGRTVVDRWHVTDWDPQVDVGFGLDRDRFSDLLFERLDRLP